MIAGTAEAPKVNTPVMGPGGIFVTYWQYWLAGLWKIIQTLVTGIRPIITLDADTTLTNAHSEGVLRTILLCTGTHTQTLPLDATTQAGRSYFLFNGDTGVISIAGTINGDVLGYTLPNQYDFVEITGNGTDWYVTENN